jgi:DNA-binding transcriptional LysR family regulator
MRYDLKHLSTFIAVAEELNFHRAAERLTMAQPAVSRIVVELKGRLGSNFSNGRRAASG